MPCGFASANAAATSRTIYSSGWQRIVELIGEAARPDVGKARHPNIPWRQIVGARNILAHNYGSIDYDVLWTILHEGIPDLVTKLEPIVAALPPPE